MTDLKARLLPPRPPAAQEPHRRTPMPVRPLFQGMDLSSLKKRGQGVRSWIRIGKDGVSQVMEVDKLAIMRRCDLPARDLRLLDPLFVYPSTILGREKAIVMNLEQIRCIITADEVLLLNSLDSYVLQYVAELQRRLAMKNGFLDLNSSNRPFMNASIESLPSETRVNNMTTFGAVTSEGPHHQDESYPSRGSHADYMPFEFLAMEVALEAACTFLDTQEFGGSAGHHSPGLLAEMVLHLFFFQFFRREMLHGRLSGGGFISFLRRKCPSMKILTLEQHLS
ncbi:hypothetical protein L7F22_061339 [Adiantum nelumboides]|nr:hypothetical protein [Adiantum nelumboides]